MKKIVFESLNNFINNNHNNNKNIFKKSNFDIELDTLLPQLDTIAKENNFQKEFINKNPQPDKNGFKIFAKWTSVTDEYRYKNIKFI